MTDLERAELTLVNCGNHPIEARKLAPELTSEAYLLQQGASFLSLRAAMEACIQRQDRKYTLALVKRTERERERRENRGQALPRNRAVGGLHVALVEGVIFRPLGWYPHSEEIWTAASRRFGKPAGWYQTADRKRNVKREWWWD